MNSAIAKSPHKPLSRATTSNAVGNDDFARSASHRVVLSLKCRPYKSVMHAHFRLLGPGPKITGDRSEYFKTLERQIAIRIFEMLRSGGGRDQKPDSRDVSTTDHAEHRKAAKQVCFYRMTRGAGKVWDEPVDETWALQKIHKDLIRRMESHRSWMDQEGNEVGVDGRSLMAIGREEFEELKSSVRIKTGHRDSAHRLSPSGSEIEEENIAVSNFFCASTAKKPDYSSLKTNNIARKPTSNIAAISEPSIPFFDLDNTHVFDCTVYPSKGTLDETSSRKNGDKENSSSETTARVADTMPFEQTIITDEQIVTNASDDDAFPLKAKLAETSKVVQIKVSQPQKKRQTSPSVEATYVALKKFTPTRQSYKQIPKTPNHSHKKFVTPTASAVVKGKHFCMTPDPSDGTTVDGGYLTKEETSAAADSFHEYSLQAKLFPRAPRTPFHIIVHAMVTNATSTVPSVLHWNDVGDRFVVENVEKMGFILEHYFSHSNYSSFVRQLNLYGWKKLKDGSFYHPAFHLEMDESQPTPCRSTPSCKKQNSYATSSLSITRNANQDKDEKHDNRHTSKSDRSFKRAAFQTACRGIRSSYKSEKGDVSEEEVNKCDEYVAKSDLFLSASAEMRDGPSLSHQPPVKRKRGRPKKIRSPSESENIQPPPNKRGPGRPRKHLKLYQEVPSVLPVLPETVSRNDTEIFYNSLTGKVQSDAIDAETEYEAYWLEKNINHRHLDQPLLGESARVAEVVSGVHESTSMWTPNSVNILYTDRRNQDRSKRLSFMPTNDVEHHTNYFSPIHPNSFFRPDPNVSEECISFYQQTIPTKMDYSTPLKDQCDSSLIEFSWKSSVSYLHNDGSTADLPRFDLNELAFH